MSSRGRLAAVLASAVVVLAGCQYAEGDAGTADATYSYGGAVSLGAGSLDHVAGAYGSALFTEFRRIPGPFTMYESNEYTGPARCVAVDGMRATVVFETDLAKSRVEYGGPPAAAYVIRVEASSWGDRWSAEPASGDLSVCSPPTDAEVAAMAPDNLDGSLTVGSRLLPGEP